MAHSEVSTPESIEEIHHADPERTKDETCGETPETPRTMPSTAARDSTDSELGDPKSMYEACPYCAALFEVQDLVEHVTLCEDLSTLKAVEISLEGDTSFLPEIVGSDPTGETSKDLCPKCRQEFTLLELINHAAECKEEGIRTSSDINDFPGDEVENFCDAEGPPTLDNTELAELCPTCRRVFPLFELVNHASECKQEEQLNKGGSEVEFSEEGLNAAADVDHAGSINNDNDVDIVKDTELCPKCRQEFPLLELVNHAAECTQEEPHGAAGSTDVELPREHAKDLLDTHDNNENSVSNDNKNENDRNNDISNNDDDVDDDDEEDEDDDEDDDDESIDCHFCGIRLPEDVMRDHYLKCKEGHLERSSTEASSSLEEGRLDEGVSVAWRTASSLGSYHDCEEQCMYCLKMFPVSVLVEHACSCTGLDQSTANELEQCFYCLRTFPLNELINHAQNCDQRFVCQEDPQDYLVAEIQSQTGEVLERCMYCFKDFPVSKLILHSQNCDGDMSGPRERFQGFLPSVHDLSAFSSVAILNDTQRSALQYVITRSAQDSRSVATDLLARVQRLGYSENDLKRTLQWVRSASPIIIHINLDKVLKFLVEDTHYRNQFETGTSGGSTNITARKSWENRIFNNFYQNSSPPERVKYGVLNIVGDPRGVRKCSQYGDSFLQLKKVRLRTTFASMDTSGAGVKLSCCEHYENVLFAYSDQEITAIMDVATGKVPFHRSDCISHYKEVQIHGPVSLSENVECIVVNPRHQKESSTTKLLDRFVEKNKCNLIWMDPNDQPDSAPSSVGTIATAGSSSRRRRPVRERRLSRKHPL